MQSETSARQWDGTLSPNDFNSSVAAFCERWKDVNDSLPQWLWEPFPVVGDSSCNVGVSACYGRPIQSINLTYIFSLVMLRQQDT